MTRDDVLTRLRTHRDELRRAGVVRLSLFGTVARGETGAASDIDLVAAFDVRRRLSLLDVVGLEQCLAALLGRPVDLVEEGCLGPRLRAEVARDAIHAF